MEEEKKNEPAQEDELKQLALSDLERAKELKVTDAASYRDCCMMELQVKQAIKDVMEKLEPILTSTLEARRAALALKDSAIEPREEALAIIQDARVKFEKDELERAKQKQQDDQAAQFKKEKDEAETISKILEDSGETELAAQVRTAVSIPTVPLIVSTPKIKGVKSRTVWFYQVVDFNKIGKPYLKEDDKKIQAIVDTQHEGAVDMVGGIRVWSELVPWGAAKRK